MEIYYYQRRDRITNFGDELNTWLWQRLLPNVLEQVDAAVLVGLGTLLNDLLPQRLGAAQNVFIFSTGAGYEKKLRRIPAHWRLYCVRGPLSAQRLHLPLQVALTDGGILLRRLVKAAAPVPGAPASFMPHVHHAVFAGDLWQLICQQAEIRYIDPRWPVEQIIAAIQSSSQLIAEAMHGAIAADALGVPWIPIITSPRILPFKWRDWCASLHLPYRPVYLPPLMPEYPRYGRGVRSGMRAATHWGQSLQRTPCIPFRQQVKTAAALAKITQSGRPFLSDRTHLENLTQALEQKLVQLRQDVEQLPTL